MANTQLTTRITELLDLVRERIRRYVWIEGIAVAIAWLVATYWIALALDYLPVKLGANEMPRAARLTLLVITSLAILFVLYHFILRRAWARLHDRSLAILIERKFPEFQDSLVTAVELDKVNDADDDPLHQEMLGRARDKAHRHAANINIDEVFNFWPLRRAIGFASLAAVSILAFAFFAWPTFQLSISRLYGLTAVEYPRQTHLEMVGFKDGVLTAARGSDVTIRVHADADRRLPPPNVCTVIYKTDSGERGRINMSRKGAPRDGMQQYTLDSKPFKGILADVRFDVVGNDYRVRDQRVRVVDSPQVISVSVHCDRPTYTGLSATNAVYYPGIKLPQGSRLSLDIETNKPLVSALVQNAIDVDDSQTLTPSAENPNIVSYEINPLVENFRHEITLSDTDGVNSGKPYTVSIVTVPDSPPEVMLRLAGIGSAITPDAMIPVVGEINDDYGVDKTWFELELDPENTRQFPLTMKPGGELDSALDLREKRIADTQPLELKVDSKVVLSVRASDKYDLDDVANIGQGDRYELEVVSPSRLIALLEARELGLRKRYEQIILEMRESRDSLARVQYAPESETDGSDSGMLSSEDKTQLTPAARLERAAAMRQLRVQRGLQHTQRASQEVLGVALSFEDIRLEIINNRIDATDRKQRIQNDIAAPLKQIVAELFPIMESRLERLDDHFEEGRPENEISSAAVAAVASADDILLALEEVLQKMLELETYNELVDLVRNLIQDQDELSDRTKKQQKKSALDLLK